jgi:hypothetical protein
MNYAKLAIPLHSFAEIILIVKQLKFWRHDPWHNDTQHNDIQHNGLICDTQHKRPTAQHSVLSAVMLSVAFQLLLC